MAAVCAEKVSGLAFGAVDGDPDFQYDLFAGNNG